jgi:hypothetical protein
MTKIDELIEVYQSVIQRRLNNIDGSPNLDLHTYVLSLQEGTRVVHLLNKGSAMEAWGFARRNETILKFLLETTAEVKMRMMLTQGTWDTLMRTIGEAYGRDMSGGIRDESVMDADFKKKLSTPESIAQLLSHNPWLLTMVMITCCHSFAIKSRRTTSTATSQ